MGAGPFFARMARGGRREAAKSGHMALAISGRVYYNITEYADTPSD